MRDIDRELYSAIIFGKTSEIDSALNNGANPNVRLQEGLPLYMIAAARTGIGNAQHILARPETDLSMKTLSGEDVYEYIKGCGTFINAAIDEMKDYVGKHRPAPAAPAHAPATVPAVAPAHAAAPAVAPAAPAPPFAPPAHPATVAAEPKAGFGPREARVHYMPEKNMLSIRVGEKLAEEIGKVDPDQKLFVLQGGGIFYIRRSNYDILPRSQRGSAIGFYMSTDNRSRGPNFSFPSVKLPEGDENQALCNLFKQIMLPEHVYVGMDQDTFEGSSRAVYMPSGLESSTVHFSRDYECKKPAVPPASVAAEGMAAGPADRPAPAPAAAGPHAPPMDAARVHHPAPGIQDDIHNFNIKFENPLNHNLLASPIISCGPSLAAAINAADPGHKIFKPISGSTLQFTLHSTEGQNPRGFFRSRTGPAISLLDPSDPQAEKINALLGKMFEGSRIFDPRTITYRFSGTTTFVGDQRLAIPRDVSPGRVHDGSPLPGRDVAAAAVRARSPGVAPAPGPAGAYAQTRVSFEQLGGYDLRNNPKIQAVITMPSGERIIIPPAPAQGMLGAYVTSPSRAPALHLPKGDPRTHALMEALAGNGLAKEGIDHVNINTANHAMYFSPQLLNPNASLAISRPIHPDALRTLRESFAHGDMPHSPGLGGRSPSPSRGPVAEAAAVGGGMRGPLDVAPPRRDRSRSPERPPMDRGPGPGHGPGPILPVVFSFKNDTSHMKLLMEVSENIAGEIENSQAGLPDQEKLFIRQQSQDGRVIFALKESSGKGLGTYLTKRPGECGIHIPNGPNHDKWREFLKKVCESENKSANPNMFHASEKNAFYIEEVSDGKHMQVFPVDESKALEALQGGRMPAERARSPHHPRRSPSPPAMVLGAQAPFPPPWPPIGSRGKGIDR